MKNKLGNPAMIAAVANSKAGEKAIDKATEVIPFVLKTLFFVGFTATCLYFYLNRFKKWSYNNDFAKPTLTDEQAKLRADTIWQAIGFFTDSFATIKKQFMNINYNDFISIYNQFGERSKSMIQDKKNLIQVLQDNLGDTELAQLRFILNNHFI